MNSSKNKFKTIRQKFRINFKIIQNIRANFKEKLKKLWEILKQIWPNFAKALSIFGEK